MRTSEAGRFASFEVDGEGLVILAIPSGPGFPAATLRPWLAPLARDSRVVTVELPGTGDASREDGQDYSFAAFVSDLAAVQQAIGAKRVAVLGHGWGAAMAVEYALAHRESVSDLILVSPLRIFTGSGQDSEAQARMVERTDPSLFPRWTEGLQPQFMAALEGEASWDAVEQHGWWSDMIRTQFAALPPAAWDEAIAGSRWGLRAYATYKGAAMFDPASAMASYDLAERAAELPRDLSILILSSNHDANYVAPASRHAVPLASALPQAEFIQWDDLGHFPFVERQAEFAELLTTAMRELPIHDGYNAS